jgi:hypothetical protein
LSLRARRGQIHRSTPPRTSSCATDFKLTPVLTSNVYGEDGSGSGRESHQPSATVVAPATMRTGLRHGRRSEAFETRQATIGDGTARCGR